MRKPKIITTHASAATVHRWAKQGRRKYLNNWTICRVLNRREAPLLGCFRGRWGLIDTIKLQYGMGHVRECGPPIDGAWSTVKEYARAIRDGKMDQDIGMPAPVGHPYENTESAKELRWRPWNVRIFRGTWPPSEAWPKGHMATATQAWPSWHVYDNRWGELVIDIDPYLKAEKAADEILRDPCFWEGIESVVVEDYVSTDSPSIHRAESTGTRTR